MQYQLLNTQTSALPLNNTALHTFSCTLTSSQQPSKHPAATKTEQGTIKHGIKTPERLTTK